MYFNLTLNVLMLNTDFSPSQSKPLSLQRNDHFSRWIKHLNQTPPLFPLITPVNRFYSKSSSIVIILG